MTQDSKIKLCDNLTMLALQLDNKADDFASKNPTRTDDIENLRAKVELIRNAERAIQNLWEEFIVQNKMIDKLIKGKSVGELQE